MKLKDFKHLKDSYIHLERYVNGGSRTYSQYSGINELDVKYHPTGDNPSFEVPIYKIPHEKAMVWTSSLKEPFSSEYIQDDGVLFAVHPEIINDDSVDYMQEIRKYPKVKSIRVSPTASSRTVLVLEPETTLPGYFLKLHCPRKISRFYRRHRAAIIKLGIDVSEELMKVDLPSFGMMPKPLGMACGNMENGWGYSIRNYDPYPVIKNRALIPFFALFSQDIIHTGDPIILQQLIDMHGQDPAEFVLNKIMFPLIETWCHVHRKTGIILAPHAQNILLEVDTNLMPQRIIHRDFVVSVDRKRRNDDRLDSLEHRMLTTEEMRVKSYSLIYDSFIGHHLFDYIAKAMKEIYGVETNVLQSGCKEAFKKYFPDVNSYMDNNTYYYSDQLSADNSCKVIETNKPPTWR